GSVLGGVPSLDTLGGGVFRPRLHNHSQDWINYPGLDLLQFRSPSLVRSPRVSVYPEFGFGIEAGVQVL
uniref:Uncharacterized protein n=1 Tax=Cannabis sativa TaxID=3483 RepID=A0A803QRY1_CANSA